MLMFEILGLTSRDLILFLPNQSSVRWTNLSRFSITYLLSTRTCHCTCIRLAWDLPVYGSRPARST